MSILDEVPNYEGFFSVDEINDIIRKLGENKDVEIFDVGKSEKGVEILGLKIGSGKRNGVLYGFPHPNEPVGSLTCLFWAEYLANNKYYKEGWSWYIIPCIDPDGAFLNQGWFKGKLTLEKYCRNFYRQPAQEMIDWNFPVNYEGQRWTPKRKETAALTGLLERLRPDFVYPLHNSGFGGAYFFISKPLNFSHVNEIIELAKNLGLPLHLGAPEEDFLKEFVKPIYGTFGYADYADHYKKQGINFSEILNHGDSGMKFAESLGAFTIVTEIPYFFDKRIVNMNLSNRTKRECMVESINRSEESYEFIKKMFFLVKDSLDNSSPFYEVLKRYIDVTPGRLKVRSEVVKNEKYDSNASIAEEYDEWLSSHFSKGLMLGQFLRIAPKTICPILEKELADTFQTVKTSFETIPIQKLVQLQIGVMLITINYLKTL